MSRFNQDHKKSAEEGAKATDTPFIHKRMRNDHDKVYVAFLESIEYGRVEYEGEYKNKGQANVAVFTNGGVALDYKDGEPLVMLLEMAPKHTTRFSHKLDKPQYRGPKVFEIERLGPANDTKVAYELEFVRDLTPEEIAICEVVPLLPRFSGDNDVPSNPDTARVPPASAAPSGNIPFFANNVSPDILEWNKKVSLEMGRLGWEPEQVKNAIKHFAGDALTGSQMTDLQRNGFLSTLQSLAPGSQPEACQQLDLDEDVAFF